jgi:hypothetical protein
MSGVVKYIPISWDNTPVTENDVCDTLEEAQKLVKNWGEDGSENVILEVTAIHKKTAWTREEFTKTKSLSKQKEKNYD